MRAVLTVFALWAAGLGAAAQFGKISVLFEFLGRAYPGYAGLGMGIMVSIVGLIGLVFGIVASQLVANYGPKWCILWALVLGGVMSLIQSMLPSFPIMILTRILEGGSHLVIVIVGPTAISSLTSTRFQGAAMTLWSSFFGVSYAALAYFAPSLAQTGGELAIFYVHALWMIAVAALLGWFLPARRVALPQTVKIDWLDLHRTIYLSPSMSAPAFGFSCYTITYVAVLTLLPNAIHPDWAQVVGVGMPLVSIAVSLTFGVWVLHYLNAWRVVQVGFGCAVAFSIGLFFAKESGLATAIFAFALAGALGLVQGASFASLSQLNPNPQDQTRSAGAIAQMGNLGTTLGTPVLAVIITTFGFAGICVFVGGFSVLGIVVHSVQSYRRSSPPGLG
jgi:DHA1 family inner membrane transport protein